MSHRYFQFRYRIEPTANEASEFEYEVMIEHPATPSHDDWEELQAVVVMLNNFNASRLEKL